jgi:hypothetical protein
MNNSPGKKSSELGKPRGRSGNIFAVKNIKTDATNIAGKSLNHLLTTKFKKEVQRSSDMKITKPEITKKSCTPKYPYSKRKKFFVV